jgi:hypothetical protein
LEKLGKTSNSAFHIGASIASRLVTSNDALRKSCGKACAFGKLVIPLGISIHRDTVKIELVDNAASSMRSLGQKAYQGGQADRGIDLPGNRSGYSDFPVKDSHSPLYSLKQDIRIQIALANRRDAALISKFPGLLLQAVALLKSSQNV